MEDLDAEILAVTDPAQKRDDSDQSDSDVRDSDGGADSDDPDDDDISVDEDDDNEDEDDEEEPDDDDDADYTVEKKKTKRKPASKKKPKAKARATKAKAKPGRRVAPKVSMEGLDDDDEEQFEHDYDEDGYGDMEDRERLMKMTEVDRESVLVERVEKRKAEYDVWKMQRQIAARAKRDGFAEKRAQRASTRNKESSKHAAIENLMQSKRDKSRKLDDVSDADSEPGRKKRARADADGGSSDDGRRRRSADRDGEDDADFDAGPELQYGDIVREGLDAKGMPLYTTTPIFVRRDVLCRLSQRASFARAVEGMMVRVRVASSREPATGSYLLCRVVTAQIGKVYVLDAARGVRTNWQLLLQSGKDRKLFEMKWISSSHPTRSEWDTFRRRWLEEGQSLPSRKEVKEMLARGTSMIVQQRDRPTDAEDRAHIANMEVLYPERINWTARKTELTTALEIKVQDLQVERDSEKQRALHEDIAELQRKMENAQQMETKYVRKPRSSNAEVFKELSRKNQARNEVNTRLAASRRSRASGSGPDPYARFDTTGQNYFNIKGEGKTEEQSLVVGRVGEDDWRSCLRTWDPMEKKRKTTVKPLVPGFDVPMAGLDDLVWPPKPEWVIPDETKRVPPGVDCKYVVPRAKKRKLPKNAKIVTCEEWDRAREYGGGH